MKNGNGDTDRLLSQNMFRAIKRGFSALDTPGDDQRTVNESFLFDVGNESTGDLMWWDVFLVDTSLSSFLHLHYLCWMTVLTPNTCCRTAALQTVFRKYPVVQWLILRCLLKKYSIAAVNLRGKVQNPFINLCCISFHLSRTAGKSQKFFQWQNMFFPLCISTLKGAGAHVFGSARDFEPHKNRGSLYFFNDNKDELCQYVLKALQGRSEKCCSTNAPHQKNCKYGEDSVFYRYLQWPICRAWLQLRDWMVKWQEQGYVFLVVLDS